LLWGETQTVTVDKGAFAVELGHVAHRTSGAQGGAASDFKQAFINNSSLLISSATCASGNSYTPGANDDRLLFASFNDGGTTVEVSALPIKSVPFALQAQEIGGYGLANLMKISGAGSSVAFSSPETQSLKDLLGNDINWDMKSRKITNLADPLAANDAATRGWVLSQISSYGSGTISSIGFTAPGIFAVGNAPLIADGSIDLTLVNQQANKVFAGPAAGGDAVPTFRVLDAADIPSVDAAKIGSGTLAIARMPALTGDVTSSAGSATTAVTKVQGNAVTSTTLGAGDAGKVYKWTGTALTAGYFGIADLRNPLGTAYFPQCNSGQTLNWVSASDTLTCANISIASGSVTGLGGLATKSAVDLSSSEATGTLAAARFPALTGDITTSAGSLTTAIASGAVTDAKINDVAWGKLTAKPNTISGFGIIDSLVYNGGQLAAVTIGTTNATALTLNTNSAARLTVDSAGKIGIGTTTPGAPLEVNGEVKIGPRSLACSGATGGTVAFNGTSQVMEYCDGATWRAMTAIAGQTVPNAFSFSDQTGTGLGSTITSNTVTLTGFTGSLTATCTNCTAIARNGSWGGTSVVGFVNNDTIAIRMLSSASMGTATTATATVGGTISGTWTVTTTASGPNAFNFTDVASASTGITYTSNTVTLTGFTGPITATCNNCTGIARNGVWGVSPMTGFDSGDTIAIRRTSSPALGIATTSTISVGTTTSGTWTVTTANGCQVGIMVGQTCPDGSVYAGMSPDGTVPMYASICDSDKYWNGSACVACGSGQWSGSGTTCNTTYTRTWNNGTGNWTDTGYTSAVTGLANTAGLAALVDAGSPYNAASYCDNLTAYGHSDWYLPAKNELHILYGNRVAIGNFDVAGTYYWSSTEHTVIYAWVERFSDGNQTTSGNKNHAWSVRCVRRN